MDCYAVSCAGIRLFMKPAGRKSWVCRAFQCCAIICNEFEWESKANFCFGLIFAPEQLKDINYYILVCMEHTNKTRVLRASIVRFFKTWFKHILQRYGS